MSQPNSSQWDLSRFLQTLTFFETIPGVNWLQRTVFGSQPPQPPQPRAGMLFDFRQVDPNLSQTWGALDDIVMGGVSASAFQQQDGFARFTGVVSTANSGGFASVRTRNFEPPLDLTNYRGMELTVRGDGNRYKCLLRDRDGWDSVAFAYSFDTTASSDTEADAWMTVQIPFSEMVPVFRAKTVSDSRPLDASQIRSIQLMLSKFEYDGALNPRFTSGDFRLEIQTIAAY